MGAQGTATVNFGAAPGTNIATVAVVGQVDILAGSDVEAFLMRDATASHNAYEHGVLAFHVGITCGDIIPGTGFTIWVLTDLRLTGTWTVHWVWS